MTQTEIIDRLCDVTCRQSSVIRELSHLITQSETFDSETKDVPNLFNLREVVYGVLDSMA